MDWQKDFADLFALLNRHGVEFLVIGGYALAFHGAPRYTGDIDLFIRPTTDNAEKLLLCLEEFGFRASGLVAADMLEDRKVLELGRPPVQVHVMAAISGVSWRDAWESRVPGGYGDTPLFFIGREALIINKRATGRTKDLADIEALNPPDDRVDR